MFDLTRGQFIVLGMLILLFGIQFRMVDRYVLNEDAAKAVAKVHPATANGDGAASVLQGAAVGGPRISEIRPPEWLGWALLSVGAVLLMHSLAMPPDE